MFNDVLSVFALLLLVYLMYKVFSYLEKKKPGTYLILGGQIGLSLGLLISVGVILYLRNGKMMAVLLPGIIIGTIVGIAIGSLKKKNGRQI